MARPAANSPPHPGADLGGIRAAKACGLVTGGYMPLRFLTEAGPRPELAELYGAVELPTPDYPIRTRRNVQQSDGTVWFGPIRSKGYIATKNASLGRSDHAFNIDHKGLTRPSDVARAIDEQIARLREHTRRRPARMSRIGRNKIRHLIDRLFYALQDLE